MLAWFVLAAAIASLASAAIAESSSSKLADDLPEVEAIRMGFGNHYKLGCWTPVDVTLSGAFGDSGAGGRIDVETLDGDAVPAWFIGPKLVWTAGGTSTAYAKIGRSESPIHVRLTKLGGEGEHEPELLPDSATVSSATAIPATNEFIVELGASIGLADMFRRLDQRDLDRTTVVTLEKPQRMPDQWVGYEGADSVVVTGQAGLDKSFFDSTSVDALEHWVCLGGELLIVCGADAERLLGKDAPLARFAPGELDGVVNLPANRFGAIEFYAGADERLEASQPLSTPQWKNVKGHIELFAGVQANDLPLVVRYPLGFGQVTVVALDLDKPPFAEWRGRAKFLEKLLGRRSLATQQPATSHGAAQAKRYGYVDLSGQLRGALDQFDGVQLIPFWAVAGLALLYIGLLFPLNYWIVTRWLRRPQAAWIVFPIAVIVFGGGALALANISKGNQRRINQIDLIDVDSSAATARGTTWFNVFSSENKLYDVAVKPEPSGVKSSAAADEPSRSKNHSTNLLSWFGLSGTGIGGMDSKAASVPLFDQPYEIYPHTGIMAGVPISVWSSKSFVARWETAGGGIEADLKGTSNHRLQGALVNRLDVPLSECALLYGDWVYPLDTLRPGQTVSLDRRDPIAISTHLTQRHFQHSFTEEVTPYDRAGFDVARIVELMMFHQAAGGENYTGLMHRYQRFTDLSQQLQFDRAILVGRGPTGATIELNGQPLSETETNHHTTIYRYLLPVKPRE
jgi:hypothetical protein